MATVGQLRPSSEIDAVRAHLAVVLSSDIFVNASRQTRFLQFVVEMALAGESGSIKEYRIGREVYGRPEQFDPRIDAIVRVEAGRLRAKLREYYESAGSDARVRIELPKGSYAPVISVRPPETEGRPSRARLGSRATLLWLALAMAAGAAWLVTAGIRARPSQSSVVVLPFLDFSVDARAAQFASGLTEETVAALTHRGDLRVSGGATILPNARSATAAEIGRQMQALAAVVGSVRREGNRIRVTVQLVAVADSHNLWSETYERGLDDPLAVQTEIARHIADAAHERLTNVKKPAASRTAALEWYGKGRAILEREPADNLMTKGRDLLSHHPLQNLLEAIRDFEQAIALDPGFSEAYSGLAAAYIQAAVFDGKLTAAAEQAATSALKLNEKLPEAHAVTGRIRFFRDWDFAGAEREFGRSLELDPRDSTVNRLFADAAMLEGHANAAIVSLTKAETAYPDSPVIAVEKCLYYFHSRQFGAMEQASLELRRKHPDFPLAYWLLGLESEQAGKLVLAGEQFEACLRLSPEDPRCTPAAGHLAGVSGRRREALAIIDRLHGRSQDEYRAPYSIALVYAGLGERGAAFEWLERAWQQHDLSLPYALLDPRFDGLRGEPRFQAVLRKLRPVR